MSPASAPQLPRNSERSQSGFLLESNIPSRGIQTARIPEQNNPSSRMNSEARPGEWGKDVQISADAEKAPTQSQRKHSFWNQLFVMKEWSTCYESSSSTSSCGWLFLAYSEVVEEDVWIAFDFRYQIVHHGSGLSHDIDKRRSSNMSYAVYNIDLMHKV